MASSGTRDAAGTRLRHEASMVIGPISLGVRTAAAPFVAAALLPALGAAVLAAELVFALILFGIVVYGTQEKADRVFRLLRWARNCPEPPAPSGKAQARLDRPARGYAASLNSGNPRKEHGRSPTAMHAERAILRVDLDTGRSNPEPRQLEDRDPQSANLDNLP
jgi:hypothetical protein